MAVFALGIVLLVLAPTVVALAIRRHRGGRHRAPDPLPAVVLARTSVGAVAIGSTASAVVLVSHGVPLTRPAPDDLRAAPAATAPSTPGGTAGPTTADGGAADVPTADTPAFVPTSLSTASSVDVRRLAVATPTPAPRVVVPAPRTPVGELPASRAPQVTTTPQTEPTSDRGGSTAAARATRDAPSSDSTPAPRPGRPDSGGGKHSGSGHSGTDTDEPTSGAEPSTGSDKPSSGADEPSSGTDEPTSGADKPSPGSSKPVSGSDEPASGADKPSSATEKPSSGTEKPDHGDGGGRHRR